MTLVEEVPTRPEGLQLIGEMKGSGYRVPPALVRRADGQTLQLTPLLYAVLEAADGSRTVDLIAEEVGRRTGKPLSAENVQTLVDDQLRPLGLLTRADGSAPELRRSNPLLALRAKVAVTDPRTTRRITDPFAVLFRTWAWVPITAVFAWLAWWLLLDKGLASATYEAFNNPGLLLLVVAVTVLSAGFHEFGHAAAARSGGAQPGVMGAGVYLVWPAFYTDVTDSYRLGRVGRVRTDLGGLYFNAIVAVGIAGVWWATGWDALLLVVATQVLQMVRQLTPMVRFDGYHVLADVTGVPDLYPRIWPTLSSLWPTRWKDPKARELKPWARAVITVWVVAVVPMLVFTLVTMLFTFPRIAGTAWASVQQQWAGFTEAIGSMDVVAALAALVGVIACAFPVLAMAVMLWRLVRSVARSVWRRTAGRPVQRAMAGVLALSLVALLAWAWWPDPQRYRPVLPFEGGTLSQAVAAPLARAGVSVPTTTSVQGGYANTVLPADQPLPTEDHPVPALVLVPHQDTGSTVSGAPGTTIDDGTGTDTGTGTGTDGSTDTGEDGAPGTDEPPTWVFPFDQPLPPDEGDNQAMAVNTTDGTVTYDVAVAMVWVTDDTVLNTNEAFAAASCSDCAAVAVAFQVVLVVGDADVIVPQNLATAANYDCFRCITAAIASQLVVTVAALPDADQQVALQDLWQDIAAFAADIPSYTLAEVQQHLEDYQQQILSILGVAVEEADPVVEPSTSPSPTATGTAGASPTETASTEETDAPDTESSATPTTGSDGASSGGTDDGAATSTPSSSPSATPTESADGSSSGSTTGSTSAESPSAAPTE